ncbi:MAG: phosphoglycerate kinase [Candidatus Aenigmatarchaeota archaeon]|nr:phosphoglycerate kinase [Candidatus Aenigmarchaeota archaeon]
MKFKTIDDFNFENKTAIVRVDINLPYDEKTKKLEISERLVEAAKTIKELSDKKAKVIVLAHQGRKGDPDFVSLSEHAKMLEKQIGSKVIFSQSIVDEDAVKKIKSLKPGDIILLENVRFLDDEDIEKTPEEHSKSKLVSTLSPLAEVFVNDAFSASHRSHASIVGFSSKLPTIAGRLMEKELRSLSKALNPERPNCYILGGAKPDDCIKIMNYGLENNLIDIALSCGVLGELFLIAQGFELGEKTENFLKEKKFFDLSESLESVFKKYNEKIFLPVDVAIDENGKRKEISVDELPTDKMILDIGKETIKLYSEKIKQSKTIVVKGPAGVYEQKGFEKGTRDILNAVAKSKAFTLIGGGDTTVAMDKIGIKKESYSYISLAGGAMINYLSGKKLPGVEILKL